MPSDSADRIDEILAFCRVKPGKKCRLSRHDPAWAGDPKLPKAERRAYAEQLLSQDVSALSAAQERLYAADTWAVLLVFQAMDAAGKDGAIKHVMSGVNPQGCQVYSFKQPTSEELDHTFLWRCMKALPERGRIGIFNRSYYEDVLVARVHPAVVAAQRLPNAKPKRKSFWAARYDDINAFERHLDRNGTLVLKFFLNVSKDEQRKRFLDRIEDPAKHWKFSSADLAERGYWDDYQQAYEQMLSHTSTPWAPWHVIPADHKWVSRALVANLIVRGLTGLNLEFPTVSAEKKAQIEAARVQLEAE